MEQSYKNCQSCGMPMKRDEKGGGSNADGTKSMMYCSHCYQNGQFVLPDIFVKTGKVSLLPLTINFDFARFTSLPLAALRPIPRSRCTS